MATSKKHVKKRTFDRVLYNNEIWEVDEFSEFTKEEMVEIREQFYCPGISEDGKLCECPLTLNISSDLRDTEKVENQIWFSKSKSTVNSPINHIDGCLFINEKTTTITEEDMKNPNISRYLKTRLQNEFNAKPKPKNRTEIESEIQDNSAEVINETISKERKRGPIKSPNKLVISKFIHPNEYESRGVENDGIYYFKIELLHGANHTKSPKSIDLGFMTNQGKFFSDYVEIVLPYVNDETFGRFLSLVKEKPTQIACVGKLELIEIETNGKIYNKFKIYVNNEDYIYIHR